MVDETVQCAIKLQARFAFAWPLVIMIGGWIVAVALWYGAQAAGLPKGAAGGLAAAAMLAALGVGGWMVMGPQGTLTMDSVSLTVKPKLRPGTTVPLDDARTESRVWFEKRPGIASGYVAGRILVVRGGGSEIVLGTGGSQIASDLDPKQSPHGPIASRPSFVIDEEPFRAIARRLGVELPPPS
jgi:hypothetical protein